MADHRVHLRKFLLLANEADIAALTAKTPFMRRHHERMARSWRNVYAEAVAAEASRNG
jgi:hypothetical protein